MLQPASSMSSASPSGFSALCTWPSLLFWHVRISSSAPSWVSKPSSSFSTSTKSVNHFRGKYLVPSISRMELRFHTECCGTQGTAESSRGAEEYIRFSQKYVRHHANHRVKVVHSFHIRLCHIPFHDVFLQLLWFLRKVPCESQCRTGNEGGGAVSNASPRSEKLCSAYK